MDRTRLLDLKDGLRRVRDEAQNDLVARNVPLDAEEPVSDRTKPREQQPRRHRRERHTSLLRDWLDEKDSW